MPMTARSAAARWIRVAVVAVATIAGGSDAAAQSAPASDTTNHAAPALGATVIPTSAELSPSTPKMVFATMGIATVEGLAFAIAGNNLDYVRCRRRNRGVHGALFDDPCFGYSGNATETGWFVGSLGGAALGALAMARLRGCGFGPGVARAVTGTIIGGLPAMITAAKRSDRIPAKRSMVIGSAPILAGLTAAVAVRGCHR